MKKILSALALASVLFISCEGDNAYKVTPTSVGPLTQETKVSELETLFSNDSIVKPTENNSLSNLGSIEVYAKGGDQLLSISPATAADSSKIRTVQVFDDRYKTSEGINLKSTFGDIRDAYEISKIQTLLSSVVIIVDEINASFTIDKQELSSELQFDREVKISEAQIPDTAKIKYFMIGW